MVVIYMLVAGWPAYRIGTDGSLWSRHAMGPRGRYGPWRRKICVPRRRSGHLGATLCEGTRRKSVYIHHLVLEAFLGPRPEGMESRHLNGDALDNRADNLRWGTRAENGRDRALHGKSKGERQHNAKLTDEAVRDIRANCKHGKGRRDCGQSEMARKYGVSRAVVRAALANQSWAHVV